MAKVLVPVDGSELGDRILSFVDRLPARRDLEMVVARVLRRPPSGPRGSWDEEAVNAISHLCGLQTRLQDKGTRVFELLTSGDDPATEVLRLVSLLDPALVAMSTHGGGQSQAVRGKVAEKVLERCPVPVFLGTPQALPIDPGTGFAKILVPLTGSARSARVLDLVEALALEHASEVILLQVTTQEPPAGRLEGPAERLRQAGVKRVRQLSAQGDAATEILRAVDREGPDVLAMTTHSDSPEAANRWFGSVAEAVVSQCACPLLLVRIVEGAPAR